MVPTLIFFLMSVFPWSTETSTNWEQPQSTVSVRNGHYPYDLCHVTNAILNSTDGKFYVFGDSSLAEKCQKISEIWDFEAKEDVESVDCDEEYDNGHTFTIYYWFKNSNYYHLHYDMMFPLYLGVHYRKSEEELKATRLFMPVVETKRLQKLDWETEAFDKTDTYWYESVKIMAGNHTVKPLNRELRNESKTLCFKNLYVGTEQWRKQDYAFVKSFVAYVKNQVGVNATAVPHRPRSKVALIQRKRRRRILNEEDLVEAVESFTDIDLIDFVGMSMKEQIQSMSDYDVTIGMNGAGLMNGIYLPPHGTIVQLVPYEAKLNFVMYGELLAARGPYLVWHNTHEELTRARPHDSHGGQSDTFVHTKEFIELTQKAIQMAAHNETKKHEEL